MQHRAQDIARKQTKHKTQRCKLKRWTIQTWIEYMLGWLRGASRIM